MLSLLIIAALAQQPAEPAQPDDDIPEGWTRLEVEPRGAAEPEALPEPMPEPSVEPVSQEREIVVWGDGAVRHASEDIVRSIEGLGYKTRRRKKDGTVVFRPPSSWQGQVRLNSGLLEFGRPVVKLWLHKPERETHYDAARTLDGTDVQESSGLRFAVLPSKSRLEGVQRRVLEGSRDEVLYYRDVVQRTASEDVLYALPSQLDRLWADGTRLDGQAEKLESMADRRAHVLAFWASRTDNAEGQRVSGAVEAWLGGVVQESGDPLTAAEITAAEADAGRSLGL